MGRLAISIGCPSGIGPEVSIEAARARKNIVLVGDEGVLREAAKVRKLNLEGIEIFQPTASLAKKDRIPGKPSVRGGEAQLEWIDAATDMVSRGEADALVTAPVSKDAIYRSGAKGSKNFRGHTEHLAARLHAPEVTMAFWTEKLTTSLVTTHLPLTKVAKSITEEEVARAIYWTVDFVARLGERGVVGVASLNPHAGENGLLGNEEIETITPAIERAKQRVRKAGLTHLTIEGPVPAESAFRLAVNGKYVAVVAMYHDQATIPMKLVGFGEAVNVSLGLPIIRTSVDHGTAYDRAMKGTADPRGMLEAVDLALKLVASGKKSRRRSA
jgi:4-phospho-D-threonate 3-dehydrogenase / 4-phospho-D-erythronate 3-dehydrogenase